jgi:peptidoglycan/LPS O-acetylase OafA/YrhL
MKLFGRKIRTEEKRLRWIFTLPLALAVAMHGLIHLMYVTSTGPGVELGFSGSSWMQGEAATALVTFLVALTVAGNCGAALGLLRFPVLKNNIIPLVIVGEAASLAAFVVMVPGLVPNAEAHVYGIVTSCVLVMGAMLHGQLSDAAGRVRARLLGRRSGAQA